MCDYLAHFFKAYPKFLNSLWRSIIQIYSNLETNLCHYKYIAPWHVYNSLDHWQIS